MDKRIELERLRKQHRDGMVRGATMVKKEFYRIREDGVALYISRSENGFYIQKVGTNEIYTEAIDVEHAPYKYVETDQKIEVEEDESKHYEI